MGSSRYSFRNSNGIVNQGDEMKKETKKHIAEVEKNINRVIDELKVRANNHDKSKLESPEAEGFEQVTHKLRELTYGSDAYKEQLKKMMPFLDHHYEKNRHHPEHFRTGIIDMTLIDLIEMLMDWLAATKRHSNGDIMKSIEINQKRFGYSNELKRIFINTIEEIKNEKNT